MGFWNERASALRTWAEYRGITLNHCFPTCLSLRHPVTNYSKLLWNKEISEKRMSLPVVGIYPWGPSWGLPLLKWKNEFVVPSNLKQRRYWRSASPSVPLCACFSTWTKWSRPRGPRPVARISPQGGILRGGGTYKYHIGCMQLPWGQTLYGGRTSLASRWRRHCLDLTVVWFECLCFL